MPLSKGAAPGTHVSASAGESSAAAGESSAATAGARRRQLPAPGQRQVQPLR